MINQPSDANSDVCHGFNASRVHVMTEAQLAAGLEAWSIAQGGAHVDGIFFKRMTVDLLRHLGGKTAVEPSRSAEAREAELRG